MIPHRAIRYLPCLMGFCVVTAALSTTADEPASATTAPTSLLSAGEPWALVGDAVSPAFSPDGNTVVFARGEGATRHVYVSRRKDGHWSKPERATFSGRWMDIEPAMAPDGSYLVFISNRPAHPEGKPLDGYFGGKLQPQRGGNLWKVDFNSGKWGTPVRLPDTVNVGTAIYSPTVAADGTLYFTHPDPVTHHTRLYVSRVIAGHYQSPRPATFSNGIESDYDPAVAPDQSFLIFSSNRPPAPHGQSGLFVAFATRDGWGAPVSIGVTGYEARLSPDARTLYYTSDVDGHLRSLPIAGWLAQHVPVRDRP